MSRAGKLGARLDLTPCRDGYRACAASSIVAGAVAIGSATASAATTTAATAGRYRLLDLLLELLLVGLLAGLRLVRPRELELFFRKLGVGCGLLERIGGAVVLDLVLVTVRERPLGCGGQPSVTSIRTLGGLAGTPLTCAFAVTSHGTPRSAQRVSR